MSHPITAHDHGNEYEESKENVFDKVEINTYEDYYNRKVIKGVSFDVFLDRLSFDPIYRASIDSEIAALGIVDRADDEGEAQGDWER